MELQPNENANCGNCRRSQNYQGRNGSIGFKSRKCLENAKTSEAVAASKFPRQMIDLKNAEENKESATPEKIEKTKNEISEVKADIEKRKHH